MVVALIGLAGWSVASTMWSLDSVASVADGERMLMYGAAVAAVFVGVERRWLRPVLVAVVAAITVVSVVGIAEHYLGSGSWNPTQGFLLIEPFGYANALAIYVVIGALLAFGFVLGARSGVERLCGLLPFVVLLPALALTSSRGGWAALGLGAVTVLAVAGRLRSRPLVVLLVVAAVAAGVLIGSSHGQGVVLVDKYRLHYWHVALQEYRSHPLLGGGAGTFGDYFWRYHRPAAGFAREAHDSYLQTVAELGAIGLVLLVCGLAQPLAALRSPQGALVAGCLGAYVAFLAHMAIDWEWSVPPVALVGLTSGALALVGTRTEPAREPPLAPGQRRGLFVALLGLGALALARLILR
jgi:O-antigen ligase